ncbi:hypothetical protein Q7P36_009099 [Cladosporium allicinum]
MAALPTTQRAILQPSATSTAVKLITNHPVPSPNFNLNEHLIQVRTTAITTGELLWPKNFPLPAPYTTTKVLIPCNDVAGTVLLAPPKSPFQPGTEVYARSSYTRTGCARKYTILTGEEIALKPKNLSWPEAAATPMSAETAWQALFVHAGLKAEAGVGGKGKRVFVTAASGGVGVWVVQLAKWVGASVVGSCSAKNEGWVRGLGADEVVERGRGLRGWVAENPEQRQVDLVVDCFGGQVLEEAWWVVREGGIVVSIFEEPDGRRPEGCEVRVAKSLFFVMGSDGEQLGRVTRLVEDGVCRPSVDWVVPFGEFERGFERVAGGGTRGKVVLDLEGE